MISKERRILSGKGRFIDDLELPNMAHCVFIGSPYAHARIKTIDVSKALKKSGILAVLTGEDLVKRTEPLPMLSDFSGRPGWHWRAPRIYPLAVEKVRFHGEPVAAIIAETPTLALEAADLIEVEYDPLPPVLDAEEAMKKGAPLVYEEWGDNIQLHTLFNFGDVEKVFQEADRILQVSWRENRTSGFPLEPRGCLAMYEPMTETLNTWGSYQCPFRAQHYISHVLRLPQTNVRVVASDIGGGFGNKINIWKYTVVCLAAILIGRPVKWHESTREFILTGPHQRDVRWESEVAIKNDGRILGIKARFIQDLGVEISNRDYAAPSIVAACSCVPNAYRLQGLRVEAYGIVTNKSFYGAYRGFGKDKGAKFMERIMDLMSRECKLDPAELRLKNFIQPHEFPYRQISGLVYDSGNYPVIMQEALRLAEVDTWRKKQKELRQKGQYIGIGMAFVVEPAGIAAPNARFSGLVQARVRITPDGLAEVYSDRTEIGQGAERTNTLVISHILGVKPEDVIIKPVTSDTIGMGPISSRGAVYSVSALARAAKAVKSIIIKYASAFFKDDPGNIRLEDGAIYSVKNPENRLNFKELADRFYFRPGPRGLPQEMQMNHEILLDVSTSWYSPNNAQNPTTTYTTFAASADIAVLEVDIETGVTKILKYVHVHDAGKMISRDTVDGQIYGGIVQGIGEALSEELIYNERGELSTDSYADFVIPTAVDAPDIIIKHFETPSPYTELGTKGMGESPIIGSKAVIISAIEEALSPFHVRVSEAPATRERVRQWIQNGPAR
ncbi:MAG: xanthine dehydrogenase family protein molybdopterin-binding subunit [Deltaproteobacteria bacterium]|nr:xanthine dehydrogenase family protein molybdopterin-binding subunit [Deltaproteobacteria bacterium]